MFAIVSLLDSASRSQVQRIWNELETNCGLTGVRVTPYPHFTWHTADSYESNHLESYLAKLAETVKPFTVQSTGLGIFTGVSPVIYVPVVKNQVMIKIHEKIWHEAKDLSNQANSHYSPDLWIPHITLAFKDITPEKMNCSLKQLSNRNFDWEIKIDNFAIVCQVENRVGELVKLINLNN